jgi:hypothetical protein
MRQKAVANMRFSAADLLMKESAPVVGDWKAFSDVIAIFFR